jgi:tetratricopeptide (TPR) repeat protein
MFTEDYLMRIINQALAALMTAIGLRKAGRYSEARQAIDQAIEQLTTLPSSLIDQMDDASILSMLTTQGQLDLGRLAILADLFQEEGEILFNSDKPAQALNAFARALRFILEAALGDESGPAPENIGKIEFLCQRLEGRDLPVETQLALSDYYQRLLDKDDQMLAAAGMSRKQVSEALAKVQDQLGSSQNKIGD